MFDKLMVEDRKSKANYNVIRKRRDGDKDKEVIRFKEAECKKKNR